MLQSSPQAGDVNATRSFTEELANKGKKGRGKYGKKANIPEYTEEHIIHTDNEEREDQYEREFFPHKVHA